MSSEFSKFLTDWLAWAEAGAPEHKIFSKHYGLCRCAKQLQALDEIDVRIELLWTLPDSVYPFGGYDTFKQESEAGTIHMNEKRLNWVRQLLGSHENKR